MDEERKSDIYLSGAEKENSAQKKKRFSFLGSFVIILFAVVIFFISPLPRFLISLVPANYFRNMFYSMYEVVEVVSEPLYIDKTFTLTQKPNFPVLGRDTGLCFKIEDTSQIPSDIIAQLQQGDSMIRVAAIDALDNAYLMDKVTVDYPRDVENLLVVCQKFSTRVSIIPGNIDRIVIKPNFAFTAASIHWATHKDISQVF